MIVALDSNVVIYLVEANPTWAPIAATRVAQIRAGGDEIAVCDVARLECLAKPLKEGNETDVETYRTFFATPHVKMLSATAEAWERAAVLVATYQFKPLDAMHLATAIECHCEVFLTNDQKLHACREITVEVLSV